MSEVTIVDFFKFKTISEVQSNVVKDTIVEFKHNSQPKSQSLDLRIWDLDFDLRLDNKDKKIFFYITKVTISIINT